MDPLLAAANATLLLSYAVRDMLWLRLLTLVGTGLLVAFELDGANNPQVLAWYGLFVAINSVHTLWLMWERRPVRLTAEEAALHERAFAALTPRTFRALLQWASWDTALPGQAVLTEGQSTHLLLVVAEGLAVIGRDGRAVASVEAGAFVGEMGFLTGQPASADVVAVTPLRYVTWSAVALRQALQTQPELEATLNGVLGVDLARKLAAR